MMLQADGTLLLTDIASVLHYDITLYVYTDLYIAIYGWQHTLANLCFW